MMIKAKFILPAILIILTLLILLSLGFWQLDRADEKRAIENTIATARISPAKQIDTITELLQKEHYQVLLKGRFDGDKQFIYDNQIIRSNAGYYVLTPFILNEKTAILVNRGFVAWHGNRNKLTNIAIDSREKIIKVGLIKPKQRILLKKNKIDKVFPMLVQSLNLPELSKLSGYQFIPMLAQLDIQSGDGFYRKWQPFYGSADKHLGYALQWFLMAFVLFIIGLMLLHKNVKKTFIR